MCTWRRPGLRSGQSLRSRRRHGSCLRGETTPRVAAGKYARSRAVSPAKRPKTALSPSGTAPDLWGRHERSTWKIDADGRHGRRTVERLRGGTRGRGHSLRAEASDARVEKAAAPISDPTEGVDRYAAGTEWRCTSQKYSASEAPDDFVTSSRTRRSSGRAALLQGRHLESGAIPSRSR